MPAPSAYEAAPGVLRIDAPLPIPEPPRVNCYLLSVGDERVLVDTGMHGSEVALDAALAELGTHVDRVALTHGHPDHWGIAARYADTALAHPDIQSQLDWPHQRTPVISLQGLPPGREVDDALVDDLMAYHRDIDEPPTIDPIHEGDRIGEWVVLVTPGHAPGHVCLYRERDGVLIAGDTLLPLITPNIHLTAEMPDAVGDYLESLRRLAGLDVSLVLPGHGEPFSDAETRAAELVAHHVRRLTKIEGLLQSSGPTGTASLSQHVFSSVEHPTDQFLAELETYAHLEHLRLRGRVTLEQHDVWRAA